MSRKAGVLTMTDLRAGSEQALVLAGRIAERSGLLLDVLHALGLRGMPLRDAVPELHGLDRRILSIDQSIRSLIRSHFPHWDHVPGPVIDVDDGPTALTRRAAQLKPPIVVLPSCWNSERRHTGADSIAAIATIQAPVLLMGSTGVSRVERAVLLRTETAVLPSLLRCAREWTLWFHAVCGPSAVPGEPTLDMVVLDAAPGQRAHAPALNEPSLVLVPKAALAGPAGESMRAAVESIVVQQRAHVLIMPESAPPSFLPECELDRSLVAAEV